MRTLIGCRRYFVSPRAPSSHCRQLLQLRSLSDLLDSEVGDTEEVSLARVRYPDREGSLFCGRARNVVDHRKRKVADEEEGPGEPSSFRPRS